MTRALPILIYALVAIVPVVAGGNRPLVWMLSGVAVGIIGLAYAFLPEARRRGRANTFRFEGWLFAGFLAFAGLQLVPAIAVGVPGIDGTIVPQISLSPGDSLLSLVTFASCGLVFVILAGSIRGGDSTRGMWVLFTIAVVEAVFALVSLRLLGDTILGTEKEAYQGFATGTFVNRNALADFVGIGVPAGVCLFVNGFIETDRNRRVASMGLAAVGTAFLIAALLASGSRAGTVATAAAVLSTMILLTIRYRGALDWRWMGAAVLVGIAILGFNYGAELTGRGFYIVLDAEVRTDLYRQVWAAILERPLTGYGGGSFQVVFPVFQAPPVAGQVIWDKAHSTYLSLFFEYGLIFGWLPIIVVASLAGRCLVSIFNRTGGGAQVAAFGAALILALHAFVDFGLEMQGVAYMLAAWLALGAGSIRSPQTRAIDPDGSAEETISATS